MITALLGALSLSAVKPSDPPIRITLNSDGYYERGDRAKVRLRVADDGYVVVLRVDADGRVRVLYPLDPGDDNFVRGGHDFELRGRGDRETFYVDDASGDGTVLGAWSARPFHFERYVRGDHWDYRVLAGNDQMKDDAEAGLVDLVTDMASGEHFEYDVARYSVGSDNDRSYRTRYYSTNYYDPFFYDPWYDPYYSSGLHIGFGFGYPYRYRPYYYDPFFYDPFFYDPFFYSGYGYYRPRGYGYSSFCWGDPFCYGYSGYNRSGRSFGGGFAFKPRAVPPLVLPRQRTPFNTALGVSRREPQSGGWLHRGDPLGVMTRRPSDNKPRFDPMRPVERDGAQPNNTGDRRRDEPSRDSYRGRDKPSRGSDAPSREARPSNGGDRGSSNSGRSSGGGGYRPSGGGGGHSTPSSGGGSRSSGGGSRSSGGGSRPSNSSGGRRGGH